MYEETSSCPFHSICRDVQLLRRVEAQLIHERRDLFAEHSTMHRDDYTTTLEEYRKRIENVGKAMNRCQNSYKRCLRFWQLKKLEEEKSSRRLIEEIYLHTRHNFVSG
jgi:hypothetical protein